MGQRIADNAAQIQTLKEQAMKRDERLDHHENEIESVKDDICQMKKNISAETSYDVAAKAAINEITDIESRKNNIVLFKLPEPDNNIKDGAMRKEDDNKRVEKLLDEIKCKEAMRDLTSSFRAGKPDKSSTAHPRPLILTFSSQQTREKILKNAKLLAKSTYKAVSIQPDLTQKQREHEKELWRECEILNEKLSDDDAKNWVHRPWGAPGAKKIRRMRIRAEDGNPNKRKDRSTSPEAEDQRNTRTRIS